MPPSNIQHRRTHNLLLISKLLNQQESASPFTLLLDTIEQSAKPLIREYINRAQRSKTRVVFASFETLRAPAGVDDFIPLWQHALEQAQRKIEPTLARSSQKTLLILDSLNAVASSPSTADYLPGLLASLIRPHVSVVATYHLDVPISSYAQSNAYAPSPVSLLRYLATAIITVHCIHHLLAQKEAQDRGVAEPTFGLDQGVEGSLVGEGAQSNEGLVLEMEFRRKSGRGIREWFFLRTDRLSSKAQAQNSGDGKQASRDAGIMLLEDHPRWRQSDQGAVATSENSAGDEVTFSLGLTEKQRQDREGVVLPYFDAQKGGGEGGRILYDMGVEDDFDEEEDEI